MDVTDIKTGQPVALASFLDGKKPLLVWFWAPHWPACNGEAPGVEQFARQNADKINVLGLGTQDDLDQAKAFQTKHDISAVKLVWDSTGQSWAKLNIPAQPAWMLIKADGTIVSGELGAIPYDNLLAQV
jgi:thiol-disulfide isomerase/thioredoxin